MSDMLCAQHDMNMLKEVRLEGFKNPNKNISVENLCELKLIGPKDICPHKILAILTY